MTPAPRCPHCLALLQAPEGDERQASQRDGLLTCASCGGAFCGVETLKGLIQKAHQSRSISSYARRSVILDKPVQYLRCPTCDQLMLRHNFGASSGVIVDVCGQHGVWFDNGELAQALSFCAAGQLDEIKTLEKYQQQAQRRAAVIPLHFEDTSTRSTTEQSVAGVLFDILWAVLRLYFS